MTRIRTVTLELLRHGPPHNQLLSPLTPYLGLCGNYGAASVKVPYEHGEFLSRLKMLRYQDPASKAGRRYKDENLAKESIAIQQEQIKETAEKMADILQTIPGLVSELNEGPNGDNIMTHLQLVISHSELALLPFELAKVPEGCKGGRGNWLSLQTHSPVCITRQVRGIQSNQACWGSAPRILFAFAATSNMDELVQAHTTALTKSILPWLHHFDDDPKKMKQEFDKHLTILPNATIETIEDACSKESYTHIHILAHGALDKYSQGNRYGINLCRRRGTQDKKGAFETICGEQLAMALGSTSASCPGSDGMQNRGHPLIVTIASCDSGNQGDVIYDGASFAHELHQSGIPFVVASQFPLSFGGSVVMAEELYERLMCGVDPRLAVHALRGKLSALHDPGVHDWAALIVYAALPDNIDSQLVKYRYQRASAAINASMSHMDALIDKSHHKIDTHEKPKPDELARLMLHVDQATKRLPTEPDYLTESIGLRGTVEKRKAEAYYRFAKLDKEHGEEHLKKSLALLKRAHIYYFDATQVTLKSTDKLLRKKRELHWPLTQYLSLGLALKEKVDDKLWQTAFFSTEVELKSSSVKTRVWARWSRIELYLLKAATSTNENTYNKIKKQALKVAEDLWHEAHRHSFATYSSRRQLERYINWWGDEFFINQLKSKTQRETLKRAMKFAEDLLKDLPEENINSV
jgi:hypothetical protein